ncbi:hypothetical protein V1282_000884 [Nitrobacteraceae bacterium AZCC 2146]
MSPNSTRREARPRPIFAADVRRLGGVVTVHASADRVDGSPRFIVGHTSRGGDCCWRSLPMVDEDHAAAAARILAEFVGGSVR